MYFSPKSMVRFLFSFFFFFFWLLPTAKSKKIKTMKKNFHPNEGKTSMIFHQHDLVYDSTTSYFFKVSRIIEKKARPYSLRHRKCDVWGFIHELLVSKTRTSEIRASEGFWHKQRVIKTPVRSTFYAVNCLLHIRREFSLK